MRALAGLVGIVVIVGILWDAFETIILPRRVTRQVPLGPPFLSVHLAAPVEIRLRNHLPTRGQRPCLVSTDRYPFFFL